MYASIISTPSTVGASSKGFRCLRDGVESLVREVDGPQYTMPGGLCAGLVKRPIDNEETAHHRLNVMRS